MLDMSKEILNQFNINPNMDNKYFIHAKETFQYLSNIKEKDFISDHVSYAVKTLERYYKGFLLEASENTSYVPPLDKNKGKTILETSHNLVKLRHEIQMNFPEVIPRARTTDEKDLERKLIDFSGAYRNASYEDFYEYSYLQKILDISKREIFYISEFLEKDNPFKDHQIDD